MKRSPIHRKIGLGARRKPARARSWRSGSPDSDELERDCKELAEALLVRHAPRSLVISKLGKQPTEEQKRFHAHLRAFCQVCGLKDASIHHILASAPGKVGRRDHDFVVGLCGWHHNLGTKSVHLLGSEAAFAREHGIDLVAVAVENLRKWNEGCGRERT